MSASIYDIPVKRLSGEDSSLGAFKARWFWWSTWHRSAG